MSESTAEPTPETIEPLAKFLDVAEANGTPGEPSIVVWLTTDHVDRDGEVIVAKGVDYRQFLSTNPAVCVVHDYKKWPVGTMDERAGGWIKLKSGNGFTGLTGKVIFDAGDSEAIQIAGKYKRGIARAVSIGAEPPKDLRPGEWGPPTAEELKARPDWAGARRIIRRCVLNELSLCPLGVNPHALTISKAATDVSPAVRKMIDKAMSEESASSGGEADEPSKPAVKSGHYVEWGHGRKAGCGKVLSIHKAGKVPGVDEDVEGSDDDPAAKVRLYKCLDSGGYSATKKCMGHKCAALSIIEHDMDGAEDEPETEQDEVIKSEESVYGYCPECGGKGVMRERRADGNDRCENGHIYPSRSAKMMKPKAAATLPPLPTLKIGRTRAEVEAEQVTRITDMLEARYYGAI